MVGNPAQQRSAGDIGQNIDAFFGIAFLGQFVAKIAHSGVFDPNREIQQYAVRAEFGKVLYL